jgi:hypothetical protein
VTRRALLALPLLLAACGNDLAPPAVIANLRVIGVRGLPPEGHVGDQVDVEALVLQPAPAVAVERLWAACVLSPGQTTGGCALPEGGALPPSCAADPEASLCLLGDGEAASYTLPARARLGRDADENGVVIISLAIAAVEDGGVMQCLATLADPETRPENCRLAIKRLQVLPDAITTPNQNPGLVGFVRDGDTLRVTLADDAVELTPTGPESLYLSWYVTGGELEKFRTDDDPEGLSNLWTLPEEPGTYQAAVVLHDGRGGTSWQTLQLTIPDEGI